MSTSVPLARPTPNRRKAIVSSAPLRYARQRPWNGPFVNTLETKISLGRHPPPIVTRGRRSARQSELRKKRSSTCTHTTTPPHYTLFHSNGHRSTGINTKFTYTHRRTCLSVKKRQNASPSNRLRSTKSKRYRKIRSGGRGRSYRRRPTLTSNQATRLSRKGITWLLLYRPLESPSPRPLSGLTTQTR